MNKNRKKNRETESTAEAKLKGFLDMIARFPLVKDIVGYLKMCHSILPIKR